MNRESSNRLICLTVDHEIFGDGSGDVRRHMIAPTGSMAAICETFGFRLTVFFETEEYLAFGREREALANRMGYDPAAELCEQAVELARRGHDLQLHLHPEWLGARLTDDGWILRPGQSTVDSLFLDQEETDRYILERKQVVDGFYQEAGSTERVVAYRCGAFCAQPGSKLIRALAANGIVLDSSAVKGLTRNTETATLDYTHAPERRRHWRVLTDVALEHPDGPVTELPIHSRMGRRYQQLTPRRLMAKFSKNVPKQKQRQLLGELGIGRTPASLVRFLGRRFPIKLDFHNMSAGQLLRWIRKEPPPPDGDLDILVLIGHSKEHRDDREFERFLAGVSADPLLRVVTMGQIARMLAVEPARHQVGSPFPLEPHIVPVS